MLNHLENKVFRALTASSGDFLTLAGNAWNAKVQPAPVLFFSDWLFNDGEVCPIIKDIDGLFFIETIAPFDDIRCSNSWNTRAASLHIVERLNLAGSRSQLLVSLA